jgi:hypothetical protein
MKAFLTLSKLLKKNKVLRPIKLIKPKTLFFGRISLIVIRLLYPILHRLYNKLQWRTNFKTNIAFLLQDIPTGIMAQMGHIS